MPSISLSLDTADRMARGEVCRVVLGASHYYKLNAREWAAYEAAKHECYLVLPGRGERTRTNLRNVWCAYTEARRWPFVVVEPRKIWAHVEMDLILLPWRLNAVSVDLIRVVLDEHAKPRKAHAGSVFTYCDFVPLSIAPYVAGRLFQIAGDDITTAEECDEPGRSRI